MRQNKNGHGRRDTALHQMVFHVQDRRRELSHHSYLYDVGVFSETDTIRKLLAIPNHKSKNRK